VANAHHLTWPFVEMGSREVFAQAGLEPHLILPISASGVASMTGVIHQAAVSNRFK
jgi:hypothetical protein